MWVVLWAAGLWVWSEGHGGARCHYDRGSPKHLLATHHDEDEVARHIDNCIAGPERSYVEARKKEQL